MIVGRLVACEALQDTMEVGWGVTSERMVTGRSIRLEIEITNPGDEAGNELMAIVRSGAPVRIEGLEDPGVAKPTKKIAKPVREPAAMPELDGLIATIEKETGVDYDALNARMGAW